jgi:hypothetical protein
MALQKLPGLVTAKVGGFRNLDTGTYKFKIFKKSVDDAGIISLFMETLDGPVQKDKSDAAGALASFKIDPNTEEKVKSEIQNSLVKQLAAALGVKIVPDKQNPADGSINFDAFVDQVVIGRVETKPSRNDPSKVFMNFRGFSAVPGAKKEEFEAD